MKCELCLGDVQTLGNGDLACGCGEVLTREEVDAAFEEFETDTLPPAFEQAEEWDEFAAEDEFEESVDALYADADAEGFFDAEW